MRSPRTAKFGGRRHFFHSFDIARLHGFRAALAYQRASSRARRISFAPLSLLESQRLAYMTLKTAQRLSPSPLCGVSRGKISTMPAYLAFLNTRLRDHRRGATCKISRFRHERFMLFIFFSAATPREGSAFSRLTPLDYFSPRADAPPHAAFPRCPSMSPPYHLITLLSAASGWFSLLSRISCCAQAKQRYDTRGLRVIGLLLHISGHRIRFSYFTIFAGWRAVPHTAILSPLLE